MFILYESRVLYGIQTYTKYYGKIIDSQVSPQQVKGFAWLIQKNFGERKKLHFKEECERASTTIGQAEQRRVTGRFKAKRGEL